MDIKHIKSYDIIEFILALICIFIGKFEDAFTVYAFIFTSIYNIIYVVYLRKLNNKNILRCIADIISIWAYTIVILSDLYILYIMIFGCTTMFGDTIYYGIDAVEHNLLAIILLPLSTVNIIYIILYKVVDRSIQSKKDKITN